VKANVKSNERARGPVAPVRTFRSRTGLRQRKRPTRLLKALCILAPASYYRVRLMPWAGDRFLFFSFLSVSMCLTCSEGKKGETSC
jgi:hypothetical protein